MAEGSGSSHRDECLRRIRRTAPPATGKMDVVHAGAARAGAAARRCLGPRQGEKDRGRSRRWPHHPGTRGRADRGAAAMSDKLRILVTGFGPFPGAPFNPTMPLVARLTRLRRPAFGGVELSGQLFDVTYI